MTEPLVGGCACGAIRYTATGPVKFAFRCQCRACQRDSGGGHLPLAAVPRNGFSHTGTPAFHARATDSGHALRKAFCPACGSPLWNEPARAPALVVLMAGNLDDPAAVTTERTVYAESAIPWDTIAAEEGSA